MPDLLLELFSEEIPARMQVKAARDLERAVNDRLIAAGFMPEGVKGFATPRRLTVVATGLPGKQPDRREEKKGPRVGAPEKAVAGFLKSAGLSSLDECEQREDKKGAYYVAVIDRKGRDTADLIAEFAPEIVRGFSWPKSMRWGTSNGDGGDLRWVRPLHRILCAFDGEVVDFEIAGIRSGDKTEGHRFMAPGDIRARGFEDYAGKLRAAKVVLDTEERKEIIAGDAATLCRAQGLELVDDPGLLNEVAGLAEWPVAMMGSFDKKFLALPDEVLTASMRGHQKYFSVKDPNTGALANKFVYVANLEAPDGGAAMRRGYERVLEARLSDGWFLYNQDLKTRLEDRIKDLDKVTFFEGLGSVGDKARRVAALAKEIAPAVGADPETAERAAMLAKADLVSGMVYEFPELQGVMGRYYYLEESGISSPVSGASSPSFEAVAGATAPQDEGSNQDQTHPEAPAKRASKDDDARRIADAIRDHYKPAGQDDEVPTAPVSVAVALADKIDTLLVFFWIGKLTPTGSSDPFALRRATLSQIRILLKNEVRISIKQFCIIAASEFYLSRDKELIADEVKNELQKISSAKKRYEHIRDHLGYPYVEPNNSLPYWKNFEEDSFAPPRTIIEFFHDRLKVYLRDKGHRHDHIDAVLTDVDGGLQDDLVLIVSRLKALQAFLKTDDGESLAAAYKRAANILKAEEKKDKAAADPQGVKEELLQDAEEKALFSALKAAGAKAKDALAAEDFEAAMGALASLRAPLDAFFDNVIVNADEEALRANRLSLLARLTAATASVADFSKLEG